jgi:putative transport protein
LVIVTTKQHPQVPVLGVAVPYAVGNVFLTALGPIIVACTFVG